MRGPKRICVLGNSHLAAAKEGWDDLAEAHPDVALTFFGAPWDMMKGLSCQEGVLVPGSERLAKKLNRTSGGLSEVVLNDYDAVVLWGLQFGARRLLKIYRTHRPVSFEWPEPLVDLAPMRRDTTALQRIPERLFDAAVSAAFSDSLAIRLAEAILGARQMPMVLVAAPGFSERALDTGEWDGVLGAEDTQKVTQRYHKLAAQVVPDGVDVVLPRDSMTVHGIFTRAMYAAADNADGTPDLVHTNAAYAGEMMRHALTALAGLRPAVPVFERQRHLTLAGE